MAIPEPVHNLGKPGATSLSAHKEIKILQISRSKNLNCAIDRKIFIGEDKSSGAGEREHKKMSTLFIISFQGPTNLVPYRNKPEKFSRNHCAAG